MRSSIPVLTLPDGGADASRQFERLSVRGQGTHTAINADDLLGPKERKDPKQRAAEEFLNEMFQDREAVAADEIFQKAEEIGIKTSTLYTAKSALGIGSELMADGRHKMWKRRK